MKLSTAFLYIKSDYFRYYPKFTSLGFISAYLYNKGFRYSFWFRLAKLDNKLLSFISKVKLKFLIWDTGIDIPPGVSIGFGIYIGHPQSIVINPNVKIGNYCNLSQFISIGSNDIHAAEIGDYVYIGPLVSIVGKVNVGSYVSIGAGSVIVKDVPENATVAGNPAKILNYNNPGRFIRVFQDQ